MGAKPANGRAQRLSELVEAAMQEKGWNPREAAEEAKKKGIRFLSARNIRAYKSGERKRDPSHDIVSAFARLFGRDPGKCSQQVFQEQDQPPLLFDEDHIVREQERLGADATVWIISCRLFLEDTTPAIAKMVIDNLDAGVVYAYFFPSAKSHPSDAWDSYHRFRRHALSRRFRDTPKLFGFAVDPTKFPYFSPLHTIVRSQSLKQRMARDRAYGFIEIGAPGGQSKRRWYPLPSAIWSAIESQLNDAVAPIAESELETYMEINQWLPQVRDGYIAWFKDPKNVDRYARVRQHAAHADGRCVQEIKREVLNVRRTGSDPVKYLDIGCGDGSITAQLARSLVTDVRKVSVTGLDPSAAQLERAEAACQNVDSVAFQGVDVTLEEFAANEKYDVITAVHSLYVVDLGYLRKIFDLLRPNGIACIWMGSLQENAVNRLSDAFDKEIRAGQRRNYAEDIAEHLRLSGLERRNGLLVAPYSSQASGLVDDAGQLTHSGMDVAAFCALVPNGLSEDHRTIASKVLGEGGAAAPIRDFLIVFRSPDQPSQPTGRTRTP